MKSSEIRTRFLEFFEKRGHTIVPSASLIPERDPTLLFTNAGMVPFKRIFLGQDEVPYRRATTSQRCVRAGGKHNDLEEVGRTARHHTFFEMLGNFSFGDYFKEGAIEYAWELLTGEYGLPADRLFATVHHTDDEAAELWERVAGLPPERIFRLGDADNFWQMADTGPCGPSSELHFDLRPDGARTDLEEDAFVALGDQGIMLELWNLVFMQFDRDGEGVLHPLPAPSIDTGAGLERLAAVLQGVGSNYHTDLFLPLLDRVGEVVGRPYDADSKEGVSFRVIADHARAVTFLLADGVNPSNEGRGYVLRRILRRALRHAWLLGRREPTVVEVANGLMDVMAEPFPELESRREFILTATRAEEERFLATVEGGLSRFDELAPESSEGAGGVVSGAEAFRLYDTFGFPLDLTELMAEERGYKVDVEGFEAALEEQRMRSREDRKGSGSTTVDRGLTADRLTVADGAQEFVGYDARSTRSAVLSIWAEGGQAGVQLARNPFYAEGGGQVADRGAVDGKGWHIEVEQVTRLGERVEVSGSLTGDLPDSLEGEEVVASVAGSSRHDTERHHTATHLLHAALRSVLGSHVVQRGSLVAPDRLRFDFAHPNPVTPTELRTIEDLINDGVWADHGVEIALLDREKAVERGAMALFGEKYGDIVRVVEIPGVSLELCGGTHVRHTGEIGAVRLTAETGVAAGIRRIEAIAGRRVLERMRGTEQVLSDAADLLKSQEDDVPSRIGKLLQEREELEGLLEALRSAGGAAETVVVEEEISPAGTGPFVYRAVRVRVRDADDARRWGDAFLESTARGVGALAADLGEGRTALFTFVTDDLIGAGVRADALARQLAEHTGGRGGGRAHMAQGGVGDPELIDEALRLGVGIARELAGG